MNGKSSLNKKQIIRPISIDPPIKPAPNSNVDVIDEIDDDIDNDEDEGDSNEDDEDEGDEDDADEGDDGDEGDEDDGDEGEEDEEYNEDNNEKKHTKKSSKHKGNRDSNNIDSDANDNDNDNDNDNGELDDTGDISDIQISKDDKCIYNHSNKFKSKQAGKSSPNIDTDIYEQDDLEQTEFDENIVFDDDNINQDLIVDPLERETKPILTKYERVRILGDRAKQLSTGAKPMLLGVNNLNPIDIAKLELERGVLPFIIEKVLPSGRRERWKVSELQIIN
jgi:DNA-directed RNA polymerase subunit K/omega